MVVEGGLGDAQSVGDLAQRGLLVALRGEQLEGDLDGALSGLRVSRTHRASNLRRSDLWITYLTAGYPWFYPSPCNGDTNRSTSQGIARHALVRSRGGRSPQSRTGWTEPS